MTMTFVVLLLVILAVILLGAIAGKPVGWVVVALGVIALLLLVLGGFSVHVGRGAALEDGHSDLFASAASSLNHSAFLA